MATEAVSSRKVIRVRGEAESVDDDLVVEEPVEFRLDGTALAVVMRTPATTPSWPLGSPSPRESSPVPMTWPRWSTWVKGDGMSGSPTASGSIPPVSSATSPRLRAASVRPRSTPSSGPARCRRTGPWSPGRPCSACRPSHRGAAGVRSTGGIRAAAIRGRTRTWWR